MKVLKKQRNKIYTISLIGEFTLYDIHDFNSELSDVLPKKDISTIIIDFSNLMAIDSTGIGQLIALQKKLNENGKNLILINMDEKIQKLFALLKLQEVFTIQK
ncbi:anti-sigma B factor antagonist [Marinitoga hydrogenitolerans DSM 16785]|uniref:Anti-sigma factor antagonist n=1 Tax=Marinitoga hydrogenitolerans (strain DSM 16785 / JCM 12826 / AT1271) TaxID=1122195 RepID=A0A1M4WHZ4_MARH1|nr:STAS domain-containing protein [Marinitoga hydrogenitolerans]SHE80921.1 anti-sigma B factor antagonist [Marinitoga hydrogenitolerans DSM 16785]